MQYGIQADDIEARGGYRRKVIGVADTKHQVGPRPRLRDFDAQRQRIDAQNVAGRAGDVRDMFGQQAGAAPDIEDALAR